VSFGADLLRVNVMTVDDNAVVMLLNCICRVCIDFRLFVLRSLVSNGLACRSVIVLVGISRVVCLLGVSSRQ